jgi:hypothetical protein
MFEVISRAHIKNLAHAAAESAALGTGAVVVNPFPPMSDAHAHFAHDFLEAQNELIGELVGD